MKTIRLLPLQTLSFIAFFSVVFNITLNNLSDYVINSLMNSYRIKRIVVYNHISVYYL